MNSIIFLGLNGYAWITIATIAGIFVIMARTRIRAEVVFLGALTVLLVTGVVTEEEGMAGFGSEPVVVHAAFFVIIAALIHTGVLYWLSKNVLGTPKTRVGALLRLMIPASVLSALMNSVVVSLMLCVTFSYSSPIGSIQNMLVFGPGSFRFSDFARVGVWLHIVLLVAMLAVVNIMYPMYI